jgi:hypothetical protein
VLAGEFHVGKWVIRLSWKLLAKIISLLNVGKGLKVIKEIYQCRYRPK